MRQALLGDLILKTPMPVIAARFHKGLAIVIVRMVVKLSRYESGEESVRTVALSGGVFQNAVLMEQVVKRLRALDFKYPHMFRASTLILVNKIDLLPYVSFDVEKCLDYARQVNPNIQALRVSATTGAGMEDWCRWLEDALRQPQALVLAAAVV